MFFVIICVAAVLIILKLSNNKNSLPGPWTLPFLGYLPFLDPKSPFVTLTKLAENYGPIYGLQLGTVKSVIVSDVKLMKKILLKKEASGRPPWLLFNAITKGQGIIFTNDETWKKNLKFLVEAFNLQGATKFSTNKKLLEKLLITEAEFFFKEHNEKTINLLDEIQHFVASMTSKLFFGESFPENDQSWKNILQLLDTGSKTIVSASPLNFLPFLRFIPPFNQYLSVLSSIHIKTIHNFKNIIKDCGEVKSEVPSLINIFQSKQLTFDGDLLCSILIDLLGAGIETTTTALSWLLLRLAQDADLQERISKEISTVLQGKAPTYEDFSKLPLLKATICESARTRSITPISLPHYALEDFQIDGFVIPKDTTIFPLIYAVHMNPKIWDEPHKFKPERFLNNTQKFEKNENLISFLFGRRMCPGEHLASMMIYFVVVVLLQNFQIRGENIDLEPDVYGLTLAPKPQKIILKRRLSE